MRVVAFVAVSLVVGSVGCAHHKKDQYAFAPPYAPPVYPQPAGYQQPIASPVGTGGAAPPAAVVGAPMQAGAPCDPVPQGTVMSAGSPCPPGEYIVPGSMVGGEIPCPP
jgi:hypothetical protein